MLPPVDPAVLVSNPKFSALYSDLCNNKLNPDGTSKLDVKAQKDRDTLDEELRTARIQGARRELVKNGLSEVSYRAEELPEDLRQLVAVVAAVLDGQIAVEDHYLIRDDITKYTTEIEKVSAALSRRFQQDAMTLASMLDADSPVAIEDLPAAITKLKTSVSTSKSQLHQYRLTLADEAVRLHNLYRQIVDRSIHLLEQVLHGSVSRASKAQAEYLALMAEGMEKKLSLQYAQLQSQLYTPELLAALDERATALQSERGAVKKNIRVAEAELARYVSAGGMEKVASEYGSVLAEMEKVRADIARLENVE